MTSTMTSSSTTATPPGPALAVGLAAGVSGASRGPGRSVTLSGSREAHWVLRLGDTCLIHAQRLSEWCGHGPILEEDIALANLSLDLLGQARALLSHAGQLDGQGLDEDQLAFLRDERDYLNLSLVEQPLRRSSAHAPGGDFADVQVRNLLLAVWLRLHWQALASSSDAELAAIADPAERETTFQTMVDRMYEHGKGLSVATHFEIDDVIDPIDTRSWITSIISAWARPDRRGKKRPNIDTW